MDFSWPDEYLTFKHKVIEFASKELNEKNLENDSKGFFSKEKWDKCASFGIQGLSVPSEFGGAKEEIDFMRAMLAMEGLGYGCRENGLAFGLNAQMWTVQLPIVNFGSYAQKQKYLPIMAKGAAIGCHALTEPEAGSDIYNMKMTAEKADGGYILNGQKRLITFAPIADVALVFASTNRARGKWGVTAFLVDKGIIGFEQSQVKEKMGMRTIPIGDLSFSNCFIPKENVLGTEGMGFSILNHSLEYDRCCILASQLGAMERQLEDTIAFVKERNQFGEPIAKFQSVSNRIANMKLRLETSRLLLYKVAWLKKEGNSAMLETAMLKLYLGENFVESSLDAIRSRGGSGYLTEFEVERDLRDAVGGVLYAGTSDIQRNIISKMMGL